MKKWMILNNSGHGIRDTGYKKILDILLENRGIKTAKEKEEFLNPPDPYCEASSSAYTLTAKDLHIDPKQLDKAVSRINKAIKNKEKIIIYGDYDSDGVCATAILWETLWKMGASVLPFIPTRDEGYGMKNDRLEMFAKEGVKLVITVDQGIVAIDQGICAKKLGLDLIVTDHHLPSKEKVNAYAVIHTTKLCGAGVSWFLANQLQKTDLDLVTIGTVTDLMPLTGVNRSIVYHGLNHLKKTKRLGLLELFKAAAINPENIGTYEIGYIIGPRINAAGRMEDPMDALRLICTNKKDQALELAKKLDSQNRERQSLTEEITKTAKDLWLKEKSGNKIIFLYQEEWEHGIVGLVAGRLVEEFYRPAIVIAVEGEFSRASARSVNGFDMVGAIRESCLDLIGAHGGHPMAAGFTVETRLLEEVKKRLIKYAETNLKEESLVPSLKIDLEITPEIINFDLFNELQKLEPFGLGNPEPVFSSHSMIVDSFRTVGRDNRHLAITFELPESKLLIRSIGFNFGELIPKLKSGQKVEIAYNIVADDWNGNQKLQLKLKDIKL